MTVKIGVQLYTLRDLTEKDFEGTLRAVAKLGYQGVEFAGYGGLEAEKLRGILDELGLACAGSHIGIDRLIHHLEEEIAYNRTIGNSSLVIPWYDKNKWNNPQEREAFLEQIAGIGQACSQAGMKLLYHNHEFECEADESGNPLLDTLVERLDKETLQLELDACWAHYAGVEPGGYIRRHAGRIPLIHLKDMKRLADGGAQPVELGRGEVDLAAIVEAAVATDAQWLIVEQDTCEGSPLDSVAASMEWIRNYVAQGGRIHV